MLHRFFLSLFIVLICPVAHAQSPLEQKIISTQHAHEHLRLSLVICGPGKHITECSGHCAIRLIDSTFNDERRDLIYNFGTFSFADDEFPARFIKGDITVMLEVAPLAMFTSKYEEAGRSMQETVLLLDDAEKDAIVQFLTKNAQLDRRSYDYDFVFDNCSTRIRDMFLHVLGSKLVLGPASSDGKLKTYRQVGYEYTERQPLARLLAGLFFAHEADRNVENSKSMFVPLTLYRGLNNAMLNGNRLCGPTTSILIDRQRPGAEKGDPFFIATLLVALLLVATMFIRRLVITGKILRTIVLVVTGALGFCFLFTWFGIAHPLCAYNYNILWALPTNIFVPFLNDKVKKMYAIVAIALLAVALAIHLTELQILPLAQLWPLMLSLLLIYLSALRPFGVSRQQA